MILIGYVQHQFELKSENLVYINIPFSILSRNQNDDRYTDRPSVRVMWTATASNVINTRR